jgi:hypothetical protein
VTLSAALVLAAALGGAMQGGPASADPVTVTFDGE